MNSINKKNTVVEVEFSTNNKDYKVIRGMKPNVFEIWCDGVCLNQNSASKDYQDHLEKFILKMNYKSFTQIVILGSASFKPFMQLVPAERRMVIEDVLDIQIFSIMNTIVKSRLQENKDNFDKNRYELFSLNENLKLIKKVIESQKSRGEEALRELKAEAESISAEIEIHDGAMFDIANEIEDLEKKNEKLLKTDTRKTYNDYLKVQADLSAKFNGLKKHKEFYDKKNECPTCKQPIDEIFKKEKIERSQSKMDELLEAMDKMSSKIEDIVEQTNRRDELYKEIVQKQNDISKLKESKLRYEKELKTLENKINEKTKQDDLTENMLLQAKTEGKIEQLEKEKEQLLDDRQYIDASIQILKDGGVKTRIIKQYLPVINKKINQYLIQMGFMCHFELNENFEEIIRSNYRDEFSYHNFSEGQKKRIDLAILLAWRAVARMRNSVNTNLLIFDEVFDSALDADGTDEFLKIIHNISRDTNVFVISPKQDQFIEKFGKVYKFDIKRNFSRMIA